MSPAEQPEIILIQPSWKAYFEYIAVGAVLLFFGGLGIFVFLYMAYQLFSRKYKILPDRIICEKGLLMRTTKEIRIVKIKNVFVSQGYIADKIDVGTVRLYLGEGVQPPFAIKNIPHPQQLEKLIRKYQKDLQPQAAVKPAAATQKA